MTQTSFDTTTATTATTKEPQVTADDLRSMLRERHPSDAFALFFEVRNGTGFARTMRSADAIAMDLWPSRGLELHGFEIKVSRSDWLRELKEPAKAEEIARFCDRWWVVAPRGVVLSTELPPTWGLLVPRGGKLRVEAQAPKLEAQPVTRLFLASLLRSAQKSAASDAEIRSAVRRAVEKAEADARERADRVIESTTTGLRRELDSLNATIATFEKQSGVDIRARWDRDRIGEAVRFVLDGGVDKLRLEIDRCREIAKRVLDVTEVAR